MFEYKNLLHDNYEFYSQDLLCNLFNHPYTKIEFIERDLGVSRIIAAPIFKHIGKRPFIKKRKIGDRKLLCQ